MLMSERLVQGVDVWINTPRRPWEASGTSGMKVLVNGGLNLSELDGWWAEAYTPEVGWALGDGQEHGDDPAWDAVEADALYDLLEREVIPEFYDRDPRGIPTAWVNRMRESMAGLTPRFSAEPHRARIHQSLSMRKSLFILAIACAATLAAAAVDQKDVEYTRPGGKPVLLDLHVPDGPGPFPAAILIHGGGFDEGSRSTNVSRCSTCWPTPDTRGSASITAWRRSSASRRPSRTSPAPSSG
jgi:hypothetical protein